MNTWMKPSRSATDLPSSGALAGLTKSWKARHPKSAVEKAGAGKPAALTLPWNLAKTGRFPLFHRASYGFGRTTLFHKADRSLDNKTGQLDLLTTRGRGWPPWPFLRSETDAPLIVKLLEQEMKTRAYTAHFRSRRSCCCTTSRTNPTFCSTWKSYIPTLMKSAPFLKAKSKPSWGRMRPAPRTLKAIHGL